MRTAHSNAYHNPMYTKMQNRFNGRGTAPVQAPQATSGRIQLLSARKRAFKARSADLEREVEESSMIIDQMMREVGKALFVESAASYVTGEKTQEHRRFIREAVAPRLSQLNDTFVATLDAYITGAQERGSAAADVVSVLLALREEVLLQLGETLPPELRILSAVLDAQTPDERVELLRQHTRGEAEPVCGAAELECAASQLVDSMEALVEVPDRRLLARLCLLREEVQQVVDEGINLGGGSPGSGSEGPEHADPGASEGGGGVIPEQGQGSSPYTMLRAVPQNTVAFLKELMAVSSSERRRAILEKAFGEDWDGGAAGPSSSASAPGAGDPIFAVRPGRFLNAVKALQAELLGPQFHGSGAGSSVDPAVLRRLEEVRREALLVLTDTAGEAGYSP